MTEKKFTFNLRDLKNINGLPNLNFKDIEIYNVAPFSNPQNCSVIFSKKWISDSSWQEEAENKLKTLKGCLIILPANAKTKNKEIESNNQILLAENPRKIYAIILQYILDHQKMENFKYTKSELESVICTNSIIEEGTKIEPFVFIEHDVKIGKNCLISAGVKIGPYVSIGDNTIIRENTVIGNPGFGIERDPDGTTYRIPHLGGVKIGSNVEIGALSVVDAGTIEPTIIEDYAKIDDQTHISHNCKVGRGTLIASGATLSGSVSVGKNCWIGPNASIVNGLKVEDEAWITIGSVVVENVKKGQKVTGNFAIDHDFFVKQYVKTLMEKNKDSKTQG
ncbi:MAG: UDP-3-O-(3-hydroxymyristoyl)glucosamine N-acyltransferase [Athalassotoga sp.]